MHPGRAAHPEAGAVGAACQEHPVGAGAAEACPGQEVRAGQEAHPAQEEQEVPAGHPGQAVQEAQEARTGKEALAVPGVHQVQEAQGVRAAQTDKEAQEVQGVHQAQEAQEGQGVHQVQEVQQGHEDLLPPLMQDEPSVLQSLCSSLPEDGLSLQSEQSVLSVSSVQSPWLQSQDSVLVSVSLQQSCLQLIPKDG